jgi:hypothetical protein
MPRYRFTLTRTRLQSLVVEMVALDAQEAEHLLCDELDEADPFDALVWSDGENEGEVDYDFDGEVR